jgi:hypothetical protein
MHSPYHPTCPRCRPSGKFKLLRLIVGIDLLLVLSAAIAAVGYLALITGMYLVVMGQVFPRACASRSAWIGAAAAGKRGITADRRRQVDRKPYPICTLVHI